MLLHSWKILQKPTLTTVVGLWKLRVFKTNSLQQLLLTSWALTFGFARNELLTVSSRITSTCSQQYLSCLPGNVSATDATLSMFGTWPSSSCWCCEVFCAQRLMQVMGHSQWPCLPAVGVLATSPVCTQNLRSNYMQKLWLMSVVMWSCHNNESSTHGKALICTAGVSTRQHDWYCRLCAHVRLLTGFILLISATLNSFVVFVNDASPMTLMLMTCLVWVEGQDNSQRSLEVTLASAQDVFVCFLFLLSSRFVTVDAKDIVSCVLPCVMPNLMVPSY